MTDFYEPVGPKMKWLSGPKMEMSRPLGAKLFRGLIGGLSLLLVPLLYLAIFRARRKHANMAGEWGNTFKCQLNGWGLRKL